MSKKFVTDVSEILASGKSWADLVQQYEGIVPRFEDGVAEFDDCWGKEGEGDSFADAIVPQVEQELQQILPTVRSLITNFLTVAEAFGAQAGEVQRPQLQALDDIAAQGAESETRR
ncbi:hypothetical protein ACFUIW_09655 [Streptomyces sp. NPDC057245]|uniref:hypothetical protein n=1 Tax=Streptomyces TaxID=1883 RepID=UPI001C1E1352|nr:hypothetical protein [Streptomyces sp. A108]MBU6533101.1 hypothetical protein [Streptomyces sp. A108]